MKRKAEKSLSPSKGGKKIKPTKEEEKALLSVVLFAEGKPFFSFQFEMYNLCLSQKCFIPLA